MNINRTHSLTCTSTEMSEISWDCKWWYQFNVFIKWHWSGNPQEEIVIEIDPAKLASIGITPQQLSAQIQQSDAKVSSGQFRSKNNDLLLEVDSDLDSLERIRKIPISFSNKGQFTQLGNIAKMSRKR